MQNSYNADSPLGFPAKFGFVGLLLLGVAMLALARFLVATRAFASVVAWWAVVGFGCAVLAFLPFGVPLEDKGAAFGLLGLLAMVSVSAQSAIPAASNR